MEIPESELNDLDILLRHIHNYLYMAIKYEMHPDETKRLCDQTLKAIVNLDQRRNISKHS